MSRSRWRVALFCVAGWFGLFWGLHFFFESLMGASPTGRLAYAPVDDMPPPVELAAVQRGWPDSLNATGERVRLAAYLRKMERQAPALVPAPGAPPPQAQLDLGTLLAGADPNAGKGKAQVCASCHTFDQGGPNGIGPNLWGVVGRDIAAHPGFSYSAAMSSAPGAWSYARLFDYLASPAREIPGNRMGFAGLRRPEDRASVIRYLSTLGSSPPLPAPVGPEPDEREQDQGAE
jgi:cytochrome c